MSDLWVEARAPGPDPGDVARRAAWWREREATLAAAPAALREALSGEGPRPPEVHGWLDTYLHL